MGSQSRAASSRRPLDISISAGDLALFDADDEEADGRRSNDLARSSRSQVSFCGVKRIILQLVILTFA